MCILLFVLFGNTSLQAVVKGWLYIYQGMFIFTYCDMMSCFISTGGWKRGSIINCLERVEASSNAS